MIEKKLEDEFMLVCKQDNEKEFLNLIKKFNNPDTILKVIDMCINNKAVNCTSQLLDTLPNYSKRVNKQAVKLLNQESSSFIDKVNKKFKELQAYRYRPVDQRDKKGRN